MLIHRFASKLDLSNQNLKEIPSAVFQCKNLKKLNLSNNAIKIIPKELSLLKRLKNLDLSNNQIGGLYSKNVDMPNLEVLILNNNKIKTLPKQISNLVKLKKLGLSGNSISTLPIEFSKLGTIQTLNLANNLFVKFPEVLFELTQLKALWLNNNQFKEFPTSQIQGALLNLKLFYCFSTVVSMNAEINEDYLLLQKSKGNSIHQLNLLSLKGKNKNRFEMGQSNNTDTILTKKSLFISYCHADEEWLKKLNVPLQTMEYEGVDLEVWDDTRIDAGDLWKDEIENALNKADIAILLVSNAFLASRFIREKEVPVLLKKAETNGTTILPVIVGLCRFSKSPIGNYQAVNKPDKPLNSLSTPEQERVFYDITLEIDKILNR